jgi:hypothetical protein
LIAERRWLNALNRGHKLGSRPVDQQFALLLIVGQGGAYFYFSAPMIAREFDIYSSFILKRPKK